jgi:biotin carboxylase
VGGGLFQLDIIDTARAAGIETVVVDRRGDAPGMARADYPLVIDTANASSVLDAARTHDVQAVVTAASDVAVGAVALVVDALGLRGVGSAVATRGRDKLATYECLSQAGLRTPKTIAVNDSRQALSFVADLGNFPIVVKPRSSAGGRGVWVVEEEGELGAAIDRARGYAGADGSVLVQEFARGTSIGVEAFFFEGMLAETFILDEQYQSGFVSPVGHSLPCTLSVPQQEQVRTAIARYAAALGLQHGPANFDLRLANDEVCLIEVNMRLGGNSITDLVRLSYGVDLSLATVRAAFGESPRALLEKTIELPAAARLILKRGTGRATLADEIAALRARANVVSIDLSVTEGETASMRVDEWTLLGRCVTRGGNSVEAAAIAEDVAARVADCIELMP